MNLFTFEDMKKINRNTLGNFVPLELFRSIRLIGMYQGLPMRGKNTTITVGRKIGESMNASSLEEVLGLFEQLKIGIPHIIEQNENEIHIAVEDCFCEGLPVHVGNMVCDLEGAILEGALANIYDGKIHVQEVKCNVNGDKNCEYKITFIK
ncbi:V4R domain-containing protein [Calidifontibacillus erzurumensis]|uniref:4-vinyl reductase n=1 Tax=Calidifontibacillus erzurumensis TaxID=2741433 RepID=A0A8J8GDP7_9BACI|nr:V4R domain-containing protein [Calidifontibacillus erzurumensis]NSL51629.1 4-vinyl reductase [Calidifontibacillus erzurumensis]